jgi:hypothetical protein
VSDVVRHFYVAPTQAEIERIGAGCQHQPRTGDRCARGPADPIHLPPGDDVERNAEVTRQLRQRGAAA